VPLAWRREARSSGPRRRPARHRRPRFSAPSPGPRPNGGASQRPPGSARGVAPILLSLLAGGNAQGTARLRRRASPPCESRNRPGAPRTRRRASRCGSASYLDVISSPVKQDLILLADREHRVARPSSSPTRTRPLSRCRFHVFLFAPAPAWVPARRSCSFSREAAPVGGSWPPVVRRRRSRPSGLPLVAPGGAGAAVKPPRPRRPFGPAARPSGLKPGDPSRRPLQTSRSRPTSPTHAPPPSRGRDSDPPLPGVLARTNATPPQVTTAILRPSAPRPASSPNSYAYRGTRIS